MLKENKKRTKRIKNLIIVCTMTAVVLSVATYAWFIGMRTVNVSSFDVEIASTDSLLLSLDGDAWGTTITVSKKILDDLKEGSYPDHTNTWGGKGLIPMSSIGAMDPAASRMKLFEKASLTATPGGYRLLASRVDNYNVGQAEQDGYVAFDLFVRNSSGTQYITDLEELDEEAIYLTNDSEVKVAQGGVKNTGIENSVRVAFAQIGRVIGTTQEPTTITGITCETKGEVTGICRTAQIWEPNDTAHVKNAISWYETSCLKRNDKDVTKSASYTGTCGSVIDGVSYPTYAVSDAIESKDNVDVYDGPAYNGYVPEDGESKLVSYPYFTDSMKLLTGVQRPTFMTLAPNSITKIRIYIYIEGQDVDNYDFASIGKKIAVKFGFTKQRYTEDDINYEGEDLNQGEGPNGEDRTAPVITLNDPQVITITKGSTYEEKGATATDNKDTIEVKDIEITGTVNTMVAGTYTVVYKATDSSGNTGTKTRTVIVVEE